MAVENVGVRFKVGMDGTGQVQQGFDKVMGSINQSASSINGLESRLVSLRSKLKASRIGSAGFDLLTKRIKVTENALNNATRTANRTAGAMSKLSGGFGGARMAGINFNRVVQDAPFGLIAIQNNIDPLVQSFIQMRKETGSTSGALKQFLGAFKGAGGVLMVINLAVAAFTAYSLATRGAKDETDSFTTALKSMIEVADKTKDAKFLADREQIKATVDILEKEIKALERIETIGRSQALQSVGAGQAGMFSKENMRALTSAQKEDLATNEGLLETFKEMKVEADARLRVSEKLSALGLKRKETEDEINKSTKKQIEDIGILTLLYSKILGVADAANKEVRGMASSFKAVGGFVSVGDKAPLNEAIFSREQLQRDFAEINMVAKTAANALRNAFMGVWDDIFGHADNLFTKFLRDIVAGLAQIAAQQAATSIFDFLLTGLGIGLAPVTGGGSLIASGVGSLIPGGGSPNTSITVVQIGDQEIARVVNNGQNRANRLRLPTNQRAF